MDSWDWTGVALWVLTVIVFLSFMGAIFYEVYTDNQTAKVCIEQGNEWIEGNCIYERYHG